MKRKLEIINSKRTVQFFVERDLDKPLCINTAIEWADKTMIDKVEKYLRAKIILYALATTVDQREEWFNDFRKAMNE